jgi:hypothetical protein
MAMPSDQETFYVFADTSNTTCWHNLRFTRSIFSSGVAAMSDPAFRDAYLGGTADYAPFVPNSNRSTGFVSLFTSNVTAHYAVEYDAEYTRSREFPLLPSRFSAVYAFGTEQDSHEAHRLYGWNLSTLRRFRLIRNDLTRVHRANMEIVSLMRGVYSRACWSREDRDNIWRHYWIGGGSLSVEIPVIENDSFQRRQFQSGEIWEYLIEGRLELLEDH